MFTIMLRLCSTLLLTLFFLATYAQDNGEDKPKKEPKKYEDIITEDATTQEGLFTVHKVTDKYYFELPVELLDRELLVVSRISGHVKGLNFGGAGMKSRPQQVVRWQKLDDNILLRSVSYNSVADEDNPISLSVRNNNFEPIIATFPIATTKADDAAYVIEVGKLFTTDVPMIGALSKDQRKNFEIKSLDKDRSLIVRTNAFPKNVEVRHVLTYQGTKLPDNQLTDALSIEMNQSFVELPETPMQPRLYDPRVGYFSIQQTDYGIDEQRAPKRRYITRWRLEPKDPEAYARGELTEPIKPIVYYIDPATPTKWRPYIKQGVDDWQEAFEAAGFKNAIMAKAPPSAEEDPDWSPEDVRYSVIRYITTDIQNAQGPHVHDPRSGEILESDILWYHNVMNLLRNWFFIQTAAINKAAQRPQFDDEIMGQLIRFVSAHEVGHTLGLPHNMGSSVAYPVDSLRSPTFTATHGTAPSIMDYARFNYVAQPEDGVQQLMPRIGEYDEWSIIYGYRRIPKAQSAEAERATLNEWIKERAANPAYRYGAQQRRVVDPSTQTEDLGDDAVYASGLGLNNLKRIVPQLIDWTTEDARGYEDLAELYGQVVGQFRRYAGHVANNVGGVYNYQKTADEEGVIFSPVPRARQAAAVSWLNENVFATPDWLIVPDILQRIEDGGTLERLRSFQEGTLQLLFDPDRLVRMNEQSAFASRSTYPMTQLFDDTRRAIFSEVRTGRVPDVYRRNLQRAYVERMAELLQLTDAKYDHTDIKAVARGTLATLDETLKDAAKRGRSNDLSRYHFADLRARTQEVLEMGRVEVVGERKGTLRR